MRTLLILPLIAALCLAQEKSEQKEKPTQSSGPVLSRIFEIKHADVERVAGIVRLFADIRVDPAMRVIAVRAPEGEMAAVTEAIRKLDVPPPAARNIELVAYIVAASSKADSPGVNLPSELDPVAKQLRTTFSFESFRLLDTLIARTRDGQQVETTSASPTLTPNTPNAPPGIFQMRFRATIQSQNGVRSVWLDNLKFGARVPSLLDTSASGAPKGFQYHEVGINTNVDIREGQKVVVGKTGIGASTDSLILVLTARIID